MLKAFFSSKLILKKSTTWSLLILIPKTLFFQLLKTPLSSNFLKKLSITKHFLIQNFPKRCWDIRTGTATHRFTDLEGRKGFSCCDTQSRSSPLLVCSFDSVVCVWDVRKGDAQTRPLGIMEAHSDDVTQVSIFNSFIGFFIFPVIFFSLLSLHFQRCV